MNNVELINTIRKWNEKYSINQEENDILSYYCMTEFEINFGKEIHKKSIRINLRTIADNVIKILLKEFQPQSPVSSSIQYAIYVTDQIYQKDKVIKLNFSDSPFLFKLNWFNENGRDCSFQVKKLKILFNGLNCILPNNKDIFELKKQIILYHYEYSKIKSMTEIADVFYIKVHELTRLVSWYANVPGYQSLLKHWKECNAKGELCELCTLESYSSKDNRLVQISSISNRSLLFIKCCFCYIVDHKYSCFQHLKNHIKNEHSFEYDEYFKSTKERENKFNTVNRSLFSRENLEKDVKQLKILAAEEGLISELALYTYFLLMSGFRSGSSKEKANSLNKGLSNVGVNNIVLTEPNIVELNLYSKHNVVISKFKIDESIFKILSNKIESSINKNLFPIIATISYQQQIDLKYKFMQNYLDYNIFVNPSDYRRARACAELNNSLSQFKIFIEDKNELKDNFKEYLKYLNESDKERHRIHSRYTVLDLFLYNAKKVLNHSVKSKIVLHYVDERILYNFLRFYVDDHIAKGLVFKLYKSVYMLKFIAFLKIDQTACLETSYDSYVASKYEWVIAEPLYNEYGSDIYIENYLDNSWLENINFDEQNDLKIQYQAENETTSSESYTDSEFEEDNDFEL